MMARTPFLNPGPGLAASLGLSLSFAILIAAPLLKPSQAMATDVFRAQIPTQQNLARQKANELATRTELPFDHLEFDLETLANPVRKIEVKLWKDGQLFRRTAKFKLLPLNVSDGRLILRYREKNEEILLYVDPTQRKLLKISYRKEESIGDWAIAAWNWMGLILSPPAAIAISRPEKTSVVATDN